MLQVRIVQETRSVVGAIIADDKDEPTVFTMTDALGVTTPATIPSVFVHKTHGADLKEAVKKGVLV